MFDIKQSRIALTVADKLAFLMHHEKILLNYFLPTLYHLVIFGEVFLYVIINRFIPRYTQSLYKSLVMLMLYKCRYEF